MSEDLIKQFLAGGGTITRCPTVYLEPVSGAVPIKSGVSERDDIDSMPLRNRKRVARDVFLSRARAAKAAKGPSKSEINALAEQRERATRKRLEEDAAIRSMFDRGESLDEIARLKGRTVKAIKKVLRRSGFAGSFVRANPAHPKGERKPHTGGPVSAIAPEIKRLAALGTMSRKEIAEAVGCQVCTVQVHLRKAGLVKPQVRKLHPDKVAEIVRLYGDGYGSIVISRLVGCSKSAVIGHLRRLKLTSRPPGPNGRPAPETNEAI